MPMELEVVATSEDRPLPSPNVFSEPFWEGTKKHQLVLQKCSSCGKFRYYPRPRCPECLSPEAVWTQVSGRGSVYSFTIVHRPLTRWFRDKVPLVCAVIELNEGVRMVSNVEKIEPAEVSIGMPVQVFFEDVDDKITLPKFAPVPV